MDTPVQPTDNKDNRKSINKLSESNSTIDTDITNLTMDEALQQQNPPRTLENIDAQVAVAVARQRPRWPLLRWANPFPDRRAQHSTTRRAKQAKSRRQSMRHGSNLGVLNEVGEEHSTTDDETDETGAVPGDGSLVTAQDGTPFQYHGNFCTFWCWCWATRGCMFSMACLVVAAVVITLVVMLLVVNGDGAASSSSDSPNSAPSVRGSLSLTAAPSHQDIFSHPTDGGMHIPENLQQVLPEFTVRAMEDPDSPQYKAYMWLQGHLHLNQTPFWKQQQLLALVTFYHAFGGSNWPEDKKKNWLSYSVDECGWGDPMSDEYMGNGCHGDGRYQHLNLDWLVGFNIAGYPGAIKGSHMPPEISLLTRLESLGILNTGLQATLQNLLPTELLALTSLRELSFKFNNIEGSIPSYIGQFTTLSDLSLGNNFLVGTIPPQLGSLSNLEKLYIYNNRFVGYNSSCVRGHGEYPRIPSHS